MNFDVDTLINEIQTAYRSVEKTFGETSLFKKSTEDAVEFRRLGNDCYKAGQDREALIYYTRSVASASTGSEELALAYANRSAVLLRLQKYESCLLDLNRALRAHYPENLKSKLCDRRERCLTEIKSRNDSKRNVTTASQNVSDLCRPSTSKTGGQIRGDECDLHEGIADFTKFVGLQSSLHSSSYTSRKVTLHLNENRDKSMIASSDIEPGEIVSIEDIFSSLSIIEQDYENCSYCLVKFSALIPCHSCAREMYCGEHCRELAFDSYHRIECKIWSLCLNEKLNTYELLGLRSFLIGTNHGLQLRTLTSTINLNALKEETVSSEKTYSNNYLSVLRSHRYETLRNPHREVILKAVKVITILKRQSFFLYSDDENERPDLSESELFATLLLLMNFTTMELNHFRISEITSFNDSDWVENVLGFAVCPLHNAIRHSCDPNISDFVRGREHVLFALRPIKRGEQVFLSYGVSFSRNPISERVKKLSAYGFTCNCEACSFKWPLLKDLRGRRPKFLTRDKRVVEDIRRMHEVVFIEEARTLDTFKDAVQFRKMLYGNVKSPSIMIILCECLIQSFMKSLGNFYSECSASSILRC